MNFLKMWLNEYFYIINYINIFIIIGYDNFFIVVFYYK